MAELPCGIAEKKCPSPNSGGKIIEASNFLLAELAPRVSGCSGWMFSRGNEPFFSSFINAMQAFDVAIASAGAEAKSLIVSLGLRFEFGYEYISIGTHCLIRFGFAFRSIGFVFRSLRGCRSSLFVPRAWPLLCAGDEDECKDGSERTRTEGAEIVRRFRLLSVSSWFLFVVLRPFPTRSTSLRPLPFLFSAPLGLEAAELRTLPGASFVCPETFRERDSMPSIPREEKSKEAIPEAYSVHLPPSRCPFLLGGKRALHLARLFAFALLPPPGANHVQ